MFSAIVIVGLSGITAQVLLLRELLVSFYGNELTLGIILANWVLAEALGVFIFGKLADRTNKKIGLFIFLQVVFALTLPGCVFLSRVFKGALGIPFAEAIGLYAIFFTSLLIILPVGFAHGALFSVCAKLYSLFGRHPKQSIGKVYTWETIGTIAGAIILTYLFIPYLNSFRITFIVSIANLIIAVIFIKYQSDRKYLSLSAIGLTFILLLGIGPSYLHHFSLAKQWQGQRILDYRNSIYGNIVVTEKGEQKTFFYNGSPIITVPYPDITFVEEFAHLPLLFHHDPQNVLVIGGGAGGLINEIEKHSVKKIDYAELDPLLIVMLKKYPSRLINLELSDPRVSIINLDGRFFLNMTNKSYDVILIGLSRPSDLSLNRNFSEEFFALSKKRLGRDGVLAIWLPGSLAYLSLELKDLNACIINALNGVYGHVRVIPGDYNIILASDSPEIFDVTPAGLSRRIKERSINTNLLTPAYLDYRLNKKWLDWFNKSSLGATNEINRDLAPIAVFEMLIYWNKQFSTKFAQFLEVLKLINLGLIFILACGVTLALSFLFYRRHKLKLVYTIATTGFFGMLVSLILILSFQVFYGYLYHMIGILIAVFMSGIAAGSIFITKRLERIKNGRGLLIKLEVSIGLFCCVLPLILTRLYAPIHSYIGFPILFFIPGMLIGLEFPLASSVYSGSKEAVGQTAGALYAADLIGGWLAGMLGGILLLPILGLFQTCMVMVFFKLSSIILLSQEKGLTKMGF